MRTWFAVICFTLRLYQITYCFVYCLLSAQSVDYLNSVEVLWDNCRSNVMDVVEDLSTATKKEIEQLTHMIKLVSVLYENCKSLLIIKMYAEIEKKMNMATVQNRSNL